MARSCKLLVLFVALGAMANVVVSVLLVSYRTGARPLAITHDGRGPWMHGGGWEGWGWRIWRVTFLGGIEHPDTGAWVRRPPLDGATPTSVSTAHRLPPDTTRADVIEVKVGWPWLAFEGGAAVDVEAPSGDLEMKPAGALLLPIVVEPSSDAPWQPPRFDVEIRSAEGVRNGTRLIVPLYPRPAGIMVNTLVFAAMIAVATRAGLAAQDTRRRRPRRARRSKR